MQNGMKMENQHAHFPQKTTGLFDFFSGWYLYFILFFFFFFVAIFNFFNDAFKLCSSFFVFYSKD